MLEAYYYLILEQKKTKSQAVCESGFVNQTVCDASSWVPPLRHRHHDRTDSCDLDDDASVTTPSMTAGDASKQNERKSK